MMYPLKKFLIVISLFLLLLTLSCGYIVQRDVNLPFKEVYLRKVENQTLEPGLQDKMRKILYQTLMANGFNISANADKILDVQIRNFKYSTLSEISLNTVEYQVQVDVKASLYDREGNRLREFNPSSPFTTYFRTTRDLQSIIANRDLAVESLIKEICEDLMRRLIFEYASDSRI